MDKKTQTWLVIGAIGAGLAYLIYKDSAGGSTVHLVAGLMSGIKTPASGSAVLVLPSGGTWLAGQASTGTLTPRALPVPAGGSNPIAVTVAAGLSIDLQWQDASGTAQNTFLTFA